MIEKNTPLRIICLYALGQLGWSLAAYNVSSSINYFYLPPELQQAIFPSFLPAFSFLGLTLVGIITFGGRLFDALIDPFIANLSDKTQSRFGKRRIFMALSAVPLALFSYLIFHPITEGVSSQNTVWLIMATFFYYVSFAAYVIPYSALISELGHNSRERMTISTILSVAWAVGFLLGNLTPMLQGVLETQGFSSLSAFQTTVLGLSMLALFFLLMPVLFLNEKKYAQQGTAPDDFKKSFSSAFQIKNFRIFSVMFLLFWLALTFIQLGIIYFVTLLLGLEKELASQFGIISFFSSFLFYPLMGFFERKMGKKGTIQVGFLIYCLVFITLLLPISGAIRFYAVSVLAALPLAIFGILPNTIVADVAHQNELETGKNQAGMFYGIAAFMMKIGISLANLIFPSLLLLGKSVENPRGIQAAIGVALFFCIVAMIHFKNYDEKTTVNR